MATVMVSAHNLPTGSEGLNGSEAEATLVLSYGVCEIQSAMTRARSS